jgi:solute carrier family 25 S-adenosylmethionine transporter 26
MIKPIASMPILRLFCCLCVAHLSQHGLALHTPAVKKNAKSSAHLKTRLATASLVPSVLERTSSAEQPAIWKLALAGSVATLFSDVLMHPLDSIKTLQQTEQGIGLSMIAAANFIYHVGGPAAFMKGFLIWGVCDATGGALKFSTYEGLKRQLLEHDVIPSLGLQDGDSDQSLWNIMLIVLAALSFVASSLVVIPGELLKQHLQMGHYPGCFDALWHIVNTQGIFGLYSGYDGVLFRDVPYTALELSLYDMFKNVLVSRLQQNDDDGFNDENSTRELRMPEKVAIAGLTGGLAGLITTPFDTVKTKAVIDFVGMSFWDSAVLTIENHGPEALFCGATARVAWLIPVTAIYLPMYDFIKGKIQEQHDAQKAAI